DADNPEDAPPRIVDNCRRLGRLERRDRAVCLDIHGQRFAHWPSAQANPLLTVRASARGRNTPQLTQRTIGSPVSTGLPGSAVRRRVRLLRMLIIRSARSTTKIRISQATILDIRRPCRG